jgi:hypothetical protein
MKFLKRFLWIKSICHNCDGNGVFWIAEMIGFYEDCVLPGRRLKKYICPICDGRGEC